MQKTLEDNNVLSAKPVALQGHFRPVLHLKIEHVTQNQNTMKGNNKLN